MSGRYINDGGKAGRKNNVTFSKARVASKCPDTGKQYISIRAKFKIPAGTELLGAYGKSYKWKQPLEASNPPAPTHKITTAKPPTSLMRRE